MTEIVRGIHASAWIVILAVIPGLVPAFYVVRRMRWTVAAVPALALATSVLLGLGAWYLDLAAGIGITWAAWSMGIAAVLLAIPVFFLRGLPPLRWGWPGLAIGAVAGLLALLSGQHFVATADTYYHLAAARTALINDALVVRDPFFGLTELAPDVTSGVLTSLLAVWSKLSELDVLLLWEGLGVVAAISTIAAFYALAERIGKSTRAATWATLGIFFFVLYADFRTAAYPSKASLGFMFIAIIALLDLVEAPTLRLGLLAAGLGVAAVGVHMGTAQTLYVTAFAVFVAMLVWGAVKRKSVESPWKPARITGITLLALLAGSLPVVLPRLSAYAGIDMSSSKDYIAVQTGKQALVWLPGGLSIGHPAVYMVGGAGVFVLATILGVMALRRGLHDSDRRWVAVSAIGLIPFAIIAFPPITALLISLSPYMFFRLSLAFGFAPYITIAWALGEGRRPWDDIRVPSPSFMAALTLSVALFWALPFVQGNLTNQHSGAPRPGQPGFSLWETRAKDVRNLTDEIAIGAIREIVADEYPIIAATPYNGYPIAGLLPARVVAVPRGHMPTSAWNLGDGEERVVDMESFFETGRGQQYRTALAEKWGAEYVMVWVLAEEDVPTREIFDSRPDLYDPLVESRRITLYRILEQ